MMARRRTTETVPATSLEEARRRLRDLEQIVAEHARTVEELRQSEARLSAIANNLPGTIFRRIAHADGQVSYPYIGGRHLDLLGFGPEETQADPDRLIQATHPDDRAAWVEALDRAVREMTALDKERRVITASGEVKWFRTMAQLHRLANGDVVFDGIALDVTERRKAESAHRASEDRLRGILADIADAVITHDERGEVELFNAAAERMFGYSAAEVVGRPVGMLMPQPERGRHYRALHDYLKSDRDVFLGPGPREMRARRKDGSIFPIELAVSEIEVAGERLFVGTMRDITERKQAEQDLRDSESRLRQAQAMARLGHFAWDEVRDEAIYRSDVSCEIYGLPLEELPRSFEGTLERVHPDDRQRFSATIAAATAARGPYDIEYRIVRPNGEVRHVRELSQPEFDVAGRHVRSSGTTQDITEQKQAEEQLRQTQKVEALGQLTGGIAHDFNNLLAIIQGNLELLEGSLEEDDERGKLVRAALRASDRGALLTHQLLAFARKQPLRPRITELNPAVADVGEMLRRTLDETVELEMRLTAAPCRVLVDQVQLESALLNLAINARDAMAGTGHLVIRTESALLGRSIGPGGPEVTPGRYVVLAVSDNGCGMSGEVKARAFEPFFTTKEVGAGSGLGLSMVYGFVQQSGGQMVIDSAPDRGTTVKLYLPEAQGVASVAAPSRKPEKRGRDETILLVEDDGDLRRALVSVLDGLGYRTIEAGDGRAALDILGGSANIDLLLSDVVLTGGTSGPDMAREALAQRPGLKLLFMSGHAITGSARADRLIEQSGLIRKPFGRAELAERLRELFDD